MRLRAAHHRVPARRGLPTAAAAVDNLAPRTRDGLWPGRDGLRTVCERRCARADAQPVVLRLERAEPGEAVRAHGRGCLVARHLDEYIGALGEEHGALAGRLRRTESVTASGERADRELRAAGAQRRVGGREACRVVRGHWRRGDLPRMSMSQKPVFCPPDESTHGG
eukprot:6521402-Prymnesium_polylepis.2